jgi:hypothetical protein
MCVDELMKQINSKNPDRGIIQELMIRLSNATTTTTVDDDTENASKFETMALIGNVDNMTKADPTVFEPLLGYYNVSYTLTTRPKDNPVGGKWTRLWKVQRMLQHILPADDISNASSTSAVVVAQVVNAIRFDLLGGIIGIWVLLRGDAVPLVQDEADKRAAEQDTIISQKGNPPLLPNLSHRTVRVYFDKPRIGLRFFRGGANKKTVVCERVLSLGPTSSVVLDTPYVDHQIRIGKGGTSGSQFIFTRVLEEDWDAREGWKWVLADADRKTLSKNQLMIRVGICGILSILAFNVLRRTVAKRIAGMFAMGSAVIITWLTLSTGGIEVRGDTYTKGR